MKSQSIRSQRSFTEHMKTLYQGIDTMVYAAQISCANNPGEPRDCVVCPFNIRVSEPICPVEQLRHIIGDHFPQGGIKEVELSEG